MTDIDFEELDKAVNSLMNPAPASTAASQTAPGGNSESIAPSSSTQPAASSAAAEPLARPSSLTDDVAATTPLVAKRQSGRFMDVVHPSHDMMARSAPSAQPSREARALEPRVAVDSQAATQTSPVSEPVLSDNALDEIQQVTNESPSLGTPNPVSTDEKWMSNSESKDDVQVSKEDEFAKNGDEQHVDDENTQPAAQSLDSPFRTDVVVDKRPLGSPQLDVPSMVKPETDAPSDPWASEPTETPQSSTDSTLSNQALAPELSPELMAVESASFDTKADVVTGAEESVVTPSESVAPVSPGDIPAQYAAAAANVSEPSAIYDASSDIQSIAHPAKKKSGWLTVVLIVLLLLIGAGGGVAAYFLMLQ